jgi:YVTN family beta-propeller protein
MHHSLRTRVSIGLLGSLLVASATILAPSPAVAADGSAVPTYALQDQWKLGGIGGWDYLTLDSSGKRLFLSRADHVDVVDTTTGKVLSTIADTKGVHGIALAEAARRGYTSNGKGDSVTVFDLDTFKVLKEVPVSGHNPDAILYEPKGNHIFTFNGRSKDVTVLDATSLAIVKTIPVPDKPEFAVDDGAGQIFVNIESEPGKMVVIDSQTLQLKATWELPGCASPSGLALDKTHHRLFSVCDDHVMAVTAAGTGKQVARVKIGEGPDAVGFDPRHGLVFSSNGEGTLTVVHQESADRYSVAQTVKTQKGARTMAFDPAKGRLYTVSAQFGPVPPVTAEVPHPRAAPLPDTFTVLVLAAH